MVNLIHKNKMLKYTKNKIYFYKAILVYFHKVLTVHDINETYVDRLNGVKCFKFCSYAGNILCSLKMFLMFIIRLDKNEELYLKI